MDVGDLSSILSRLNSDVIDTSALTELESGIEQLRVQRFVQEFNTRKIFGKIADKQN